MNNSDNKDYLKKDWYLKDLKRLIKELDSNIDNQKGLLDEYLEKLVKNIRQIENSILNDKEYDEFLSLSHEFLNGISDKLLNTQNITSTVKIPKNIIYYLLNIKYKNVKYSLKDDNIVYKEIVDNIKDNKIKILTINYKDGYLYFDAQMDGVSFDLSKIQLIVNSKNEKIEETNIYAGYKIFGRVYYNDVIFKFRVKLSNAFSIKFKNVNGSRIKLLFSDNVSSRLVSNRKNSYYNIEDKYIKCINNEIRIYDKKAFSTFNNEIKYFVSELRHKKTKCLKPAFVRFMYFLTRCKYKNKNIYVTYDKIFKGGDCGEYMFRYLNDNTKERAYYIVNKDTMTYKKLKKKYRRRLLIFGSLKCKLVCLNAKYILSTDSEAASFCSFNKYMREYNKGLFSFENLHIQHGVTMQNMAHRQNRVFDNHKMYFVTSKYEKNNLLDPKYGYDKADLIESGLARFDGLHGDSENIILITPTWRVDVASSVGSGKVRPYNENFKHTEYFKVYNGLINNKKLIEIAKEKSYKIVFLIHPTLISNIVDYDKNEFVEIIPSNEIDYEDMLIKAKIMVTDYSGVQYDFAYMHKPIVYYHNDDLPPSYNNGAMDYEKIGFGPISKTEECVVSEIEKIINNDSLISDKYDKRINDFFYYNDFESCKRIYDAIVRRYYDKENN